MNETIRNYWGTQEVLDRGYQIRIEREEELVTITIGDEEWYTKFFIGHNKFEDDEWYSVYHSNGWANKRFNITEELEFTNSFDECIKGCMYYFITKI